MFVNLYLGLFIFVWASIYIPVMYGFSKKLNVLAFDESESRHSIIGQISDKLYKNNGL